MWISGGKLWGVGIICNRKMEELFEKQRKFGGKSVRLCKQSYAQGNPQRWELRVGINVWIMWISWEKNGVGVKRDGSESGLQHQEAATRAGQLWANHQLRLCSRGSADPRESLRRCRISSLLKAPAKGCLQLTDRRSISVDWRTRGSWRECFLYGVDACSFHVRVSRHYNIHNPTHPTET